MQIILFAIALSSAFAAAPRPSDIVNLKDVDPTIQVDMIYHGANNFTGKPVDGYTENVCLLAKSAAEALKKAQARLQEEGKKSGKLLSLAMTDCYRPQRAVKAFVAWAKLPDDPEAKRKYFPDLTKPQLISDNYISPVSGHSRAASVDLMIIEKVGSESRAIPMGTEVDFFGERSHTASPSVSAEEAKNRELLKKVMSPEFRNYSKEWWHYALIKEPYPTTFFDFDVSVNFARVPQAMGQFAVHFSDPALLAELDHDSGSALSLAALFKRIHQEASLSQPPLGGSGHPTNAVMAGFKDTYGKFAEVISADVAHIISDLAIDWEKDITKTYDVNSAKTPEGRQHRKNGNVTRIFNEKWLTSPMGQFFLAGIVNRIDRREFTPGTCGEVRFIYRLGYEMEMAGQTYASRMPTTLNMVFNYRDDHEGCKNIAALWSTLATGAGDPVSQSKKLLNGPIDFSKLVFKQMEFNGQAARFPSDLEREEARNFAGQAIYLMRIFGLRDGSFVPLKLENTPDVLAIRKSSEKQALLRKFISENLKAVDTGVYMLPESLLADVALTYSTAGSSRVANKPFDLLLSVKEAEQLVSGAGAMQFLGSGRGLLERLNTSTCMGCHQASSTAGFHFLGNDRVDLGAKNNEVKAALDGNRLVLPFSPHLFAELARRENYVSQLAMGAEPDSFRPHPSAPVAEWSGGAHSFSAAGDNMPCPLDAALANGAHWGCDKARGLNCVAIVTNPSQASGLGQCAPQKVYSGLSCRKNVIQDQAANLLEKATFTYNVRAFTDHVVKDEQLYSLPEGTLDSKNYNCRPTRIGVPLGRVTRGCTPQEMALQGLKLDPLPSEVCAIVGGKGFEEMAKGYFNSTKFAEGVGRGNLNTCSPSRYCREDYICQEMPDFLTNRRFNVNPATIKAFRENKVGFCTPTYFVYQLRLDGHPNPN